MSELRIYQHQCKKIENKESNRKEKNTHKSVIRSMTKRKKINKWKKHKKEKKEIPEVKKIVKAIET